MDSDEDIEEIRIKDIKEDIKAKQAQSLLTHKKEKKKKKKNLLDKYRGEVAKDINTANTAKLIRLNKIKNKQMKEKDDAIYAK